MRLYDIAFDVENVINGGMVVDEESGEILFDSDNLDELKLSFKDKLESCGCYIKNLDAEANAIGKEIANLQARKKSAESRSKRMREYVLDCMEIAGEKRVETPRVAISQRTSKYLEIENEFDIPENYKDIQEVVKVDKKAITDAIKSGESVNGCELKERVNLQVK